MRWWPFPAPHWLSVIRVGPVSGTCSTHINKHACIIHNITCTCTCTCSVHAYTCIIF
jgi:hypothetical protein